MPSATVKPVIFLAFANDRDDREHYLRNLPVELRAIRAELESNRDLQLWDLVERPNATAAEVVDVFQRPDYRDHVAIFHYGGHASSYALQLESAVGEVFAADADSLAAFFGQQRGLQLVFLNGCATYGQVQKLLDANVSAVIATTRSIEDKAATTFASRFYRGLASGASVQVAFDEASAATRLEAGGRTRDVYHVEPSDDRWPWELHFRPGAEVAGQWNLAEAAGDPLFGLPSVPPGDLPARPYRHLHRFTREHADVFFGRGHEIRELYEFVTSAEGAPIGFLYGDSGIGKSSLLEAGLLPRLEHSHEVRYLRRDRDKGLSATLHDGLSSDQGESTIDQAWRGIEAESGKPLVVVLDQVEEAFTLSRDTENNELRDFASKLEELFQDSQRRPVGKLLLGFRKEWLAEVEDRFIASKLPHKKVFLDRLNRAGIVESVSGPARVTRLADHYGLSIEDGLPGVIADDLLSDPASPIAPMLQILLAKMWAEAQKTATGTPTFDRALYEQLKREGLLLQDFLREQLDALRTWRAELVDTGLALDLLGRHTTDLGTAATCRVDELTMAYPHRRNVLPDLVQQCKDHYLLVEYSSNDDGSSATSLTHDTLAPLIRRKLRNSDLFGPRAGRVLENRVMEWQDGKTGAPLDELDLATVEKGAPGMRAWTAHEKRLIEASRSERARKRRVRRVVKAGFVGLGLTMMIVGMLLLRTERAKARDARASLIVTAVESLEDDPDARLKALLLAELEDPPDRTRAARLAIATLGTAVPRVILDDEGIAPIVTAAFDRAGTRIVTGHDDGTVRVWPTDGKSGPVELPRHELQVNSVEFGPDGRRVVTASSDQTAQIVWANGRGAPQPLSGHTGSVRSARFNPDGTRVVTASMDETARVWSVDEGTALHSLPHQGAVYVAEFSPDGSMVVTASADSTAHVWRLIGSRGSFPLVGHTDEVWSARFSADSKHVLTRSDDGTARVWSVGADGSSVVLGNEGGPRITAAAFSHDGYRVVTGHDNGSVELWGIDGSPEAPLPRRHAGPIWDVTFDPGDSLLVTASSDSTALVWSWRSDEPKSFVLGGHASWVTAAAFTSDGALILTASRDGTARVWPSSEPRSAFRELAGHRDRVSTLGFNSDSSMMVTASDDGTARIWATDGGEPLHVLGDVGGDPLLAASFGPDDRRVLTASEDGEAHLWSVDEEREEWHSSRHEDAVNSAVLSLDGKYVLVTSYDGTAEIWDWESNIPRTVLQETSVVAAGRRGDQGAWLTWDERGETQVWPSPTVDEPSRLWWEENRDDPVQYAALSRDGKLVVVGYEKGTVRVSRTDHQDDVKLDGHDDGVRRAAFSPDGSLVVTASSDYFARVQRSDGTGEARPFQHERAVRAAAFSPDGSQIVTASGDQARIWRTDGSGDPIVLAGHRGGVTDAAFGPQGSFVVTTSEDNTARIWELDLETLLSRIRRLTTDCLTVEERQEHLAESLKEAGRKRGACVASRRGSG